MDNLHANTKKEKTLEDKVIKVLHKSVVEAQHIADNEEAARSDEDDSKPKIKSKKTTGHVQKNNRIPDPGRKDDG